LTTFSVSGNSLRLKYKCVCVMCEREQI